MDPGPLNTTCGGGFQVLEVRLGATVRGLVRVSSGAQLGKRTGLGFRG